MLNSLKTKCRFFKSDRPCIYHKQKGVTCNGCSYYSHIDFKILVIKLDAMGDVLRTTCILQGLKEKYPNSQITWITKGESIPLLENNPFIDVLWSLEDNVTLMLLTEEFDLIINPDASSTSARLATIAKSRKKLGFGYHQQGYVYPFNVEAAPWFEMGVNDSLKKANTNTYQKIILDICRLNPSEYELIFNLTQEEKEFAKEFAKNYKIESTCQVIGLNTGAGGRWAQKKWTEEGYLSLIRLLIKDSIDVRILLYGGPEEKERNNYLKKKANTELVIDTGSNNTIRQFAALLNISNVVVTGDTLAMHLAIALKKKLVVLFGPTSYYEIDLYSRGSKIYPDMNCLVCYKQMCDKSPTCMEAITPESVYQAINNLLL